MKLKIYIVFITLILISCNKIEINEIKNNTNELIDYPPKVEDSILEEDLYLKNENGEYIYFTLNDKNKIKYIENGFDPNTPFNEYYSDYFEYLLVKQHNNLDLLLAMINHGLDVNKSYKVKTKENYKEFTPLFLAIYYSTGTEESTLIKSLIKNGANINNIDGNKGENLFSFVMKYGSPETLEYFSKQNFDINRLYYYNELDDFVTPLIAAAINDRLDLVEYLIQSSADKSLKSRKTNKTAIELYQEYYNFPDIKELLTKEISLFPNEYIDSLIKSKDSKHSFILKENNSEKLIYSIKMGWNDIIKEILSINKTRLNYVSHYGETPLRIAIINNNYSIVQLLLDCGADANYLGNERNLDYRFEKQSNINLSLHNANNSISNILLDYGANVTIPDFRTSLLQKNEEIALRLIDKGPNVTRTYGSKEGSSLLKLSLESGMNEIGMVLAKRKTRLHHIYDNNQTIINSAIIKSVDINIIKYLLENNISYKINVVPNNGISTLNKAILLNNQDLVDLLLNFGADPNVSDSRYNNSYECISQSKCNIKL